ncbi:MAG: nuclear transport factor 2 family protein [Myxococcota bacterium]
MPELPPAFDHMLAAWNERDLEKVRSHLERALSPEIHFVDPSIETRGIDAFEANVRDFRTRLPDAVCSRASGFDSHHGLFRYHWEIHRGSELVLPGFDVAEVDSDARVLRVWGFFGPVPEAPSA